MKLTHTITKPPKAFKDSKSSQIFKSASYAVLYGGSSKLILTKYKLSKRRYKIWVNKRLYNAKTNTKLNFSLIWK